MIEPKPGAFGKKQIKELNSHIHKYYGDEVNIHMFQGMFVGYMSCANDAIEAMDLVASEDPVLQITYQGNIDGEFIKLLYNGLYYRTDINNTKHNNIIPIITLEQLRGAYFTYNGLNLEEKKNLLDWYIGYFMSLGCYLNNDLIDGFLDSQNENGEDIKFGDSTLAELFEDGMCAQEITLYDLIKELKPKYSNPDIKSLIKLMIKQVEEYHPDEIIHYRHLAQSHGCSLLSSVLLIAQAAAENKNNLADLASGKVKVH